MQEFFVGVSTINYIKHTAPSGVMLHYESLRLPAFWGCFWLLKADEVVVIKKR